MRVLCVTPSYWPAFQYGGPIFVNHYLNVALVKRGIDVTVYTTNVGLGTRVLQNQEINIDGVKVIYFSITKILEFLGATGWQFSWCMTKALKENLQRDMELSVRRRCLLQQDSLCAVCRDRPWRSISIHALQQTVEEATVLLSCRETGLEECCRNSLHRRRRGRKVPSSIGA